MELASRLAASNAAEMNVVQGGQAVQAVAPACDTSACAQGVQPPMMAGDTE
jgi:hypothetical protein